MQRTAGHLSTVWSIFIWNISLDIFRPKGMYLKRYLPRCVLTVVGNELSCVR